jgi:hypothetical protein
VQGSASNATAKSVVSFTIFEKILSGPNGLIRGLGETNSWKKTRRKKSRDTVPLMSGGGWIHFQRGSKMCGHLYFLLLPVWRHLWVFVLSSPACDGVWLGNEPRQTFADGVPVSKSRKVRWLVVNFIYNSGQKKTPKERVFMSRSGQKKPTKKRVFISNSHQKSHPRSWFLYQIVVKKTTQEADRIVVKKTPKKRVFISNSGQKKPPKKRVFISNSGQKSHPRSGFLFQVVVKKATQEAGFYIE